MGKLFSMIEVEINSSCNRTCWYCPNSSRNRKEQGEMDPLLYKLLMQQLKEISFDGRISYHFYGEPLLCSYLNNYITLSKKYLPQARSVLYSNGDYLDQNKLMELISIGVEKFVVTQHVGHKSMISKIINTLPKELREKIEYLNYTDLNLTNRGGLISNIKYNIDPKVPCYIPTSMVVVTLQGNVLPCFEDYEQHCSMGNIKDTHIMDIWNSDKYKEFREALKKGNRNCYKICQYCNNVSVMDDKQFDYVL